MSSSEDQDECYYQDLITMDSTEFFSKYCSFDNDNEASFNDLAIEKPKKTYSFQDIPSDVLCYIVLNYLDWRSVFKSCLLVNKDFFRRIANNRVLFINLFNELFVMKEEELIGMNADTNFIHKKKVNSELNWVKYGGLGIPNEHYHYWKDFEPNIVTIDPSFLQSVRKFHIKNRKMTETKLKLIRERWNNAAQIYRKSKGSKVISQKEENQALLNLIKRIIKDRLFLRRCLNGELRSIRISYKDLEFYMNKYSLSRNEALKIYKQQTTIETQIENMVNGASEYTMSVDLEEIVAGNCLRLITSNDYLIESIEKFSENVISVCTNDLGEEDRHISYLRSEKFKEVFETFPNMKSFISRGVFQNISPVKSNNLNVLVLLSGGMPAEMLKSVLSCEFPQLKHLELWLGSYLCGNSIRLQDFGDLFSIEENGRYPLLEYVGIRNTELADQYLMPISNSNILTRLRIFDMSLCGSVGPGAMVQFAKRLEERGRQSLPFLELVDFHRNYLSENEKQILIEIFDRLEIIVDVTSYNSSRHIAIME